MTPREATRTQIIAAYSSWIVSSQSCAESTHIRRVLARNYACKVSTWIPQWIADTKQVPRITCTQDECAHRKGTKQANAREARLSRRLLPHRAHHHNCIMYATAGAATCADAPARCQLKCARENPSLVCRFVRPSWWIMEWGSDDGEAGHAAELTLTRFTVTRSPGARYPVISSQLKDSEMYPSALPYATERRL
jgi:hypothetical protein